MTVKNPRHMTFTALALVIIAAVFISTTAFSQGSYPPPTGLTATTQSVGSGQIKLVWVKPSSSEVIGYNIYRDNVYLDYIIGAGSLSYYDTDLPPSTAYDYFVKAVYLGVAEADLPASNTVSAVSPAYCTSGPSYCVGISPFVTGPGRTIVDLKGKKLDSSHHQSEIFNVSLPAGRYQVHIRSFDAYAGRYTAGQKNERWFLALSSGGREVARTNLTIDLLDHLNEMGSTQVIETELVLTESVNKIQAVHAAVTNGGSFDDVGTSAVMFVNMDTADPGCLLVIDKTADKTEAASGDLITYTITVRNDGDANCTGGGNYIFDKLPWQVEYVSETQSGGIGTHGYYADGHYVWLVAYTPLVPGEVVVATITVRVKGDIPAASCEGDDDPGPGGGPGDDIITNQVYATNNEYGDRSMNVYSNSATTVCDAEPEPDPEIEATVVPSPNPSYPGGEVTWTATPFGECPGPFSYSWTGDDGLTGNAASVSHIYDNPGSYDATVIVSAAGCVPITLTSPTPATIQPRNLSDITCEPSPKTAAVNQQVVWMAVPTPNGDYTYNWSGDDGLNGSTQTITHSYASPGIYRARVDVEGVGNSRCDSTVNVKINPNFQEI